MKNSIKAMAFVVIGMAGAVASLLGMAAMYFSTTFLPVYVGTVYVIGNQLIRYALYAMLAVIFVISVRLAEYGSSFLIKKFHKTKRR